MMPPPSQESVPHSEDSEPFTCAICEEEISADRPPTLNLDNCACGESGTLTNDPGDAASDSASGTVRAEVVERSYAFIGKYAAKEVDKPLRESNSTEKSTETATLCDRIPSQEGTAKISFAMEAYLLAESPLDWNNLVPQDLYYNNHQSPFASVNELSPSAPSASACATQATSSMRSSQNSYVSCGSQARNCSSDTLAGTGSWQETVGSLDSIFYRGDLSLSSSESLFSA